MDDLIVIKPEEYKKESVSVKGHLEAKPEQYEAEQKEVSENIQKFDKKVKKSKVYTENPFSYNAVSLKKDRLPVLLTQSAQNLVIDPIYNTIGKFLGVDTIHEWGKQYEKVYTITEWAKRESQEKNVSRLMEWIARKSRSLPNLGARNIDNLYIFARLEINKK